MGVFSFGGVDLSADLKVLEISRQIGNSRSVSGNSAPKLGENIEEVSIDSKTITVRVSFASRSIGATAFVDTIAYATVSNKNLQELREKIAGVLHTTVPKKLILPDEEGRYYNAIPVGDISLVGISDWYDEFEIEFKIPDGVAHSTTYRSFETTGNQNKITVTNNGTVDAFPIFTIENMAENGYVGLVNTSGVFQVGNLEEGATETFRKSEFLLDYRGSEIRTGLSRATRNVAITNTGPTSQQGTISVIVANGKEYLYLSSVGSGSSSSAGLTWSIPADSAGAVNSINDYLWWNQVFAVRNANECGVLKITVSDTSGRFLYGFETAKRSQGVDVKYNFIATNGSGGYNTLKRWTVFKLPITSSLNTPYTSDTGFLEMKRNDDKVTIFYQGSYSEIVIPEIKGVKSAKVHVCFERVDNKPLANWMYLGGIMYRKDFVEVVRHVPNRYNLGSKIVANSENNTIQIDGVFRMSDFITGSKFLSIPPGVSDIEIYNSSWATAKPHVKVEFEERWL